MVMALDVKNYPKQIVLRDETPVVLRPLEPDDKAELRRATPAGTSARFGS